MVGKQLRLIYAILLFLVANYFVAGTLYYAIKLTRSIGFVCYQMMDCNNAVNHDKKLYQDFTEDGTPTKDFYFTSSWISPRLTGRLLLMVNLPAESKLSRIDRKERRRQLMAIDGTLIVANSRHYAYPVIPLRYVSTCDQDDKADSFPLAIIKFDDKPSKRFFHLEFSRLPENVDLKEATIRLVPLGSWLWILDIVKLALFGLVSLIAAWILYNTSRHNILYFRQEFTPGRIAYVLTAYPLWSETFLRQDMQLLIKSSVDIHPISLFSGNIPVEAGWPEPIVLQKTKPYDSQRSKSFKRRLVNAVLNVLPLSLHIKLILWRHHGVKRKLRAELQKMRPAHVHVEFAGLAALLVSRVAKELGISFSVGIHAEDVHTKYLPLNVICRGASMIFACNSAAARAFREKCPKLADNVRLIYHGVQLENWPFTVHTFDFSKAIEILFIGRFVPKKGVSLLLESVSLAHQQGLNVHLTLIGAGPLEASLKQQASELGITDKLRWLGVVSHADIPAYLQKADALCLPSRVTEDGNRDGLPNVVLEAMAAGTPVISSQAGSLPEILTPDTGQVLIELSPESIVAAFAELQNNKEQIIAKCKNARKAIEHRFDATKLAMKRAKALQDLSAR